MPPLDNETMDTVLVVDDEPVVRDVVVRYLEQEGTGRCRQATATRRATYSNARRRVWSCST